MAPDRHPTREEWDARQAGAPAEVRTMLATVAAERAASRAAEDDAARLAEQVTARHRAAFEAAVTAALAAAGGDWLSPYRVPDAAIEWMERPFTLHARAYCAVFDPRDIGLNRIALDLFFRDGEWRPGDNRQWWAIRPGDRVPCYRLCEAVDVAARYASCPF